jgi:hypothetical protein
MASTASLCVLVHQVNFLVLLAGAPGRARSPRGESTLLARLRNHKPDGKDAHRKMESIGKQQPKRCSDEQKRGIV